MVHRRRSNPYGARPLSWNGSEGGSILKNEDDDEFDDSSHRGGYHQLEEHAEYSELAVEGDKRYDAASKSFI